MAVRSTRPRGRPPKGDIKGKLAKFSTRITPELREALEIAAKRSNRSLSQEAELRLINSFAGPQKAEQAFGSAENYALAAPGAGPAHVVERVPDRMMLAGVHQVLGEAVGVPDRVSLTLAQVAARLGYKPAWFRKHRARLERVEGFPPPLAGCGNRWDSKAVDLWKDAQIPAALRKPEDDTDDALDEKLRARIRVVAQRAASSG